MSKPKKLPLDEVTKKWFADHPALYYQASVIQCKTCGLWYRPSLGHKCKKKGD